MGTGRSGFPPWRRAFLPPSPGLAPLCPAGREGSRCPAAPCPLGPRRTCRAGVLPVSPPCPGAVRARGVAALLPARPANRPPAGGVGDWRPVPPEPAPSPPSCPPLPGPRGQRAGAAGGCSCQDCSLSHGLTALLQTPPWAWLPPARPAPLPRSVWARRERGRRE